MTQDSGCQSTASAVGIFSQRLRAGIEGAVCIKRGLLQHGNGAGRHCIWNRGGQARRVSYGIEA